MGELGKIKDEDLIVSNEEKPQVKKVMEQGPLPSEWGSAVLKEVPECVEHLFSKGQTLYFNTSMYYKCPHGITEADGGYIHSCHNQFLALEANVGPTESTAYQFRCDRCGNINISDNGLYLIGVDRFEKK